MIPPAMSQVAVLGCMFVVFTGAEQVPQIEELFNRQAEQEKKSRARHAELEAQIVSLQRFVSLKQDSSESQLAPVYDNKKAEPARALTSIDNNILSNLQSDLENTKIELAAVQGTLVELGTCLDYLWLLVCGAMVMFMQAGFSFLEAGSCRVKNAGTVLTKNALDAVIGTVIWYFVGYGVAYGVPDENPNEFIGVKNFAGMEFDLGNHYRDWFFQWAFCATTATIVSGAVAERIMFEGYILYCVVMTGFIYPVIVYWTWSGAGFLTIMGYSDFAGSGIVHFTGGMGAVVGASILGSRKGRWESKSASRFDPHNMSMVVLGTMILWFGWYGFNCGSTLALSTADTAKQAALVAMNTTIAASVGGLTIFIRRLHFGEKRMDLAGTCNGILAGLVCVCAGVGDIEPYMAFVIGVAGGLAHEIGSATLKRFKVDDPCDAFAVHGCGGVAGVLLRPLLDKTGPQWEMFSVHCLALLCIGAWSGGLTALTFGTLKYANILRVDHREEVEGADAHLSARKNALGRSSSQSLYNFDDEEEKAEQALMHANDMKMRMILRQFLCNDMKKMMFSYWVEATAISKEEKKNPGSRKGSLGSVETNLPQEFEAKDEPNKADPEEATKADPAITAEEATKADPAITSEEGVLHTL